MCVQEGEMMNGTGIAALYPMILSARLLSVTGDAKTQLVKVRTRVRILRYANILLLKFESQKKP